MNAYDHHRNKQRRAHLQKRIDEIQAQIDAESNVDAMDSETLLLMRAARNYQRARLNY